MEMLLVQQIFLGRAPFKRIGCLGWHKANLGTSNTAAVGVQHTTHD